MNDGYGIGEPPQNVLLAIEQLISGERTIGEFRDELLNVLYENPGTAASLSSMVNDYSRRGLIPEPIQRLLLRDIDKITDEEHATTPTEFTYTAQQTNELELTSTDASLVEEVVIELPEVRESSQPATVTSLEIGALLRDRFEIIGRAAGGSMGVVYKAIDRRQAEAEGGQPVVAIKVLAPDYAGHASAMRALQQEATKGRYLNHPAIVRFLDLDRSGDLVFLVMEWLDGKSLSEVLAESDTQALDRDQAMKIIGDIGAALEHAHQMGVTHADVKPGNVMLLPNGEVKLLDFGIARARGGSVGIATPEDNAFLKAATPAYASPAVLSGQSPRPVDDVFSLACLAYRILSGARVFRNKTAREAKEEGLLPPKFPGVDPQVWRGLTRALDLDESSRTQSVADFLTDLRLVDKRRSMASYWPWATAAAFVIIALSVLAIYSPTFNAPIEAVLPEVAVTAVVESEPDEVAPPSPSQPVPVVEFMVTSANVVAEAGPAPALQLSIDPQATAIPEGTLVLMEGDGPTAIRIELPDSVSADQLSFVRQFGEEALRQPVREALRLSLADPEASDVSRNSVEIVVEHVDDLMIQPTFDVDVLVVAQADRRALASLTLRMVDDELQRIGESLAEDALSFDRDIVEVTESSGAVSLTLWRLNATQVALEVPLQVDAISATPDDDFVVASEMSVEFAQGEQAVTIVIPLVQDSLAEGVELLSVYHMSEIAKDSVQSNVTVRILDDDEQ
ncbi:MAG: protein kinase [Pseudomonadota bacterium]